MAHAAPFEVKSAEHLAKSYDAFEAWDLDTCSHLQSGIQACLRGNVVVMQSSFAAPRNISTFHAGVVFYLPSCKSRARSSPLHALDCTNPSICVEHALKFSKAINLCWSSGPKSNAHAGLLTVAICCRPEEIGASGLQQLLQIVP